MLKSYAVEFALLSLFLNGVSDVIFKKYSGCSFWDFDSSELCFNGPLLNLRGTRLNSNRQYFFGLMPGVFLTLNTVFRTNFNHTLKA